MEKVRELKNAQDEREKNNNFKTNDKQNQGIRNKERKERLQWHPAFFAEMQIELEEDLQNLILENEHQLGTMPKEIDILIIKRNKSIPMKKNIGKIFRKYNIVEYKSPEDSLTINDFYKVLGYTYFYKSDTREQNCIKLHEITITFVCRHYPRELLKFLKKERDMLIEKEEGIFYVAGEKVPIQIIVTSQLSEEKNFWLKNLTNDLKEKETVEKLVEKFSEHKGDICYKSVMDTIVRANKEVFKEDGNMCDALLEMYDEQLMAKCRVRLEGEVEKKMEKKYQAIRQQMIDEGRQQGIAMERVHTEKAENEVKRLKVRLHELEEELSTMVHR